MTDRKKLIELVEEGIRKSYSGCWDHDCKDSCRYRDGEHDCMAVAVAETLLENGVVLLPCKVGDILYITEPRFYNYTKHEGVQRGACVSYNLDERCGWMVWVNQDEGAPHTSYAYKFSDFGKTVFLTHEEAEAALKEVE